tara:strand:- start:6 stop:140 length:135 start_codon:yes stop_codon:yes gene_type:complete
MGKGNICRTYGSTYRGRKVKKRKRAKEEVNGQNSNGRPRGRRKS